MKGALDTMVDVAGWRGQIYPGQSSNAFTEGNGPKMAEVIWCEIDDPEMNMPKQIGHPFSAKDPDAHHYGDTQMVDVPTGDSYGRPTFQRRERVTDEFDMCGYHYRKQNPFLAKNKPEIPAPTTQKTIDELEEEDQQYRAGYNAAMERILTGKVE
jgi:hypothetical protein